MKKYALALSLSALIALPAWANETNVSVSSSMPEVNPMDYYLDFDELDADQNGFLTRQEIEDYIGCGCSQASRDNLLREFRVMDKNADRRLSREDLGSWLTLD